MLIVNSYFGSCIFLFYGVGPAFRKAKRTRSVTCLLNNVYNIGEFVDTGA